MTVFGMADFSEWRPFGMAAPRNGGSSEWQPFGMAGRHPFQQCIHPLAAAEGSRERY